MTHLKSRLLKNRLFLIASLLIFLVGGGFGYWQWNIRSDNEGVLVTLVIDGDTIEIEGGERVRYLGINAPEPAEEYGIEAFEANQSLVAGKRVTLEADIQDKDEYGRLLRYVYIDDVMVNAELVREGYAYSYSRPPNIKYQEMFLQLENEARDRKLGLWLSKG